ncbi:MAG: hypothetical protein A2V70_16465 [Planctomycetes bacterium RBG_13_63_9]|nr:MAG: hypothetical protein A2V70_16465 [Planctomycetes bacterium RBG_13_63_9]
MHGTHPIQILLGLLIAALAKALLICLLVLTAVGLVVLGLVFGGVILALFKRKRHLLWALPAINFLIYLLLLPVVVYWLWGDEWTLSDHFRFPSAHLTIIAFPCLTFLGWISAALLSPVELLLRWLGSLETRSTGDADQFVENYLRRPRAVSTWAALREGFSAPLFGFGYLCAHPHLWRYAVVPIVLSLLITGFALVLFLMALTGFVTYLHPLFPPGWAWLLLEVVCGILLLLLALGATLLTWMLLQAILCGHYYEKLARQVELQLGTRPEDLKGLSTGEQLLDALLDLALFVGVNLGFLFLHVIPGLGSIVAVLGSLYFTSYLFGAAYLGFPLCLRRRHRNERRAFIRRFRAQTVGLGIVVLLVSLLPLIGSLVLATAVVGAVLLHRRSM